MVAQRVGLAIGCIIFILSFGLMVGSWWPAPEVTRRIQLTTGESMPGDTQSSTKGFLDLELRQPAWLWFAKPGRFGLNIESIPILNPDQPTSGQPVQLAARLELSGFIVRPPGETFITAGLDQPAQFYWQVFPNQAGSYSGTIWIHWLPDGSNVNLDNRKVLLSAMPVKIEVFRLAGLSSIEAQVLGMIGMIIAGIIGFFSIRKNGNVKN